MDKRLKDTVLNKFEFIKSMPKGLSSKEWDDLAMEMAIDGAMKSLDSSKVKRFNELKEGKKEEDKLKKLFKKYGHNPKKMTSLGTRPNDEPTKKKPNLGYLGVVGQSLKNLEGGLKKKNMREGKILKFDELVKENQENMEEKPNKGMYGVFINPYRPDDPNSIMIGDLKDDGEDVLMSHPRGMIRIKPSEQKTLYRCQTNGSMMKKYDYYWRKLMKKKWGTTGLRNIP